MNSSPSHKRGSSWSSSDGSLSWSSRLPVSAGLKICLKLAVALSLKFHWLHLESSTDSLTKRVLIRWGSSTQPQHSDEQPDNQHKPPWLRLTAAVVCLSRGISFDPEPNDLNFQSFRVWVTLLYQWQPETLSGCDLTGFRCLRTYHRKHSSSLFLIFRIAFSFAILLGSLM